MRDADDDDDDDEPCGTASRTRDMLLHENHTCTDTHIYVFSLPLALSIHNKQLVLYNHIDGGHIASRSQTHPSHSQTSLLLTSSLTKPIYLYSL